RLDRSRHRRVSDSCGRPRAGSAVLEGGLPHVAEELVEPASAVAGFPVAALRQTEDRGSRAAIVIGANTRSEKGRRNWRAGKEESHADSDQIIEVSELRA